MRPAARRPVLRTAVVSGVAATALAVGTGACAAAPPQAGPAAAPPSPSPARSARVEAESAPWPEQVRAREGERLRERWPALAPAGGAAFLGTGERLAKKIVSLTNVERAKAGCRPLRTDKRLRAAAQGHADDMAARGYYEHESPEGRDAGDRMRAAGYAWSTWAENIHRGPKTPARAMEDWMKSPGHRANIRNCALKDIGVGVSMSANGPWWVQNFGVRR
ncbi:CAP domain-containing protein [Streptomyces sp. NPDC001744]|uniref:CAP domain-containing protein n=1 Tax=Streptomyces sp. NPDC001744 TaxID=3364606 RepID=UPI0036C05D5A